MRDDDKKEIKQLLMCIAGLLVVIFIHLAALTGFFLIDVLALICIAGILYLRYKKAGTQKDKEE